MIVFFLIEINIAPLSKPRALLTNMGFYVPILQSHKEFRKKLEGKPVLKGASINSDLFVGDENLNMLAEVKSKNELIGEVISLLQSPAKNVISALLSGKHTVAGLVKALEEGSSK